MSISNLLRNGKLTYSAMETGVLNTPGNTYTMKVGGRTVIIEDDNVDVKYTSASDKIIFDNELQINNVDATTTGYLSSTLITSGNLVDKNGAQTLSNKSFSNDVDMQNNKLINCGVPTNEQDCVTKQYVDASLLGLDMKESCYVATASLSRRDGQGCHKRTSSRVHFVTQALLQKPGDARRVAVEVSPTQQVLSSFESAFCHHVGACEVWGTCDQVSVQKLQIVIVVRAVASPACAQLGGR